MWISCWSTKLSNRERYLYGSYSPEEVLRNLIQSQIRNVVGSTQVDAVLTDGKEAIQMQVKSLVTEVLQEYDIGLTLVDVKIQDAEPPTQEVIEAFKAVETAKQQAETVVNQAKAYQNAQIPKAEGQADQLIQNAEYLKQARINEATEQVAMFQAMYQEYQRNPEITRSRMYYEAISQVLPGVKLYINTTNADGVDMVLPLESFVDAGEPGPRNPQPHRQREETDQMKKKIILGVLALLALVCLLSSVYTVEENQYACTVRFSKIIHTTQTPGAALQGALSGQREVFPQGYDALRHSAL